MSTEPLTDAAQSPVAGDDRSDRDAAALATLPDRRFRHAVLLGADIAGLAARCDRLDDPAGNDLPDGRWELVVLSDVLHGRDEDGLRHLADAVLHGLQPGGLCLLATSLDATDSPLDTDAAVDRFVAALSGLVVHQSGTRTGQHRIDVLSRPQGDA